MTRIVPIAAAALLVLIATDPAIAQGVGGGGGAGIFDAIFDWFLQNIARGVVLIGIAFLAIAMIVMRASLGSFVMLVVGAIIFVNAREIAGFFGL